MRIHFWQVVTRWRGGKKTKERYFFISSVPWLPYVQIKLPGGTPGDSHPRISWGRYREENGRVQIPVTLYVHHALADGLHISRFFENLRRELDAITNDKEI